MKFQKSVGNSNHFVYNSYECADKEGGSAAFKAASVSGTKRFACGTLFLKINQEIQKKIFYIVLRLFEICR